MKLAEVIKYVESCDHRGYTSITLYNPHSWRGPSEMYHRGDYSQLEFDYKLRSSTVKEMLEVLRSPIGVEYWGWKGGHYRIGESCDVYLGSPGETGEPLTKLLLQHIVDYVYVQTTIESWAHPYLAGDRKKLEKMGKILLHATEDTDMTEAWELAIAMQTRVGPHSPEGFLADLRSMKGPGTGPDWRRVYMEI
jgi:hypothetical protein